MLKKRVDYIWRYLRRLTSLSSEQIMEQFGIILLMPQDTKDTFLKYYISYFDFEMEFRKCAENLKKDILLTYLEFDFKFPTPNILKETLVNLYNLQNEYSNFEIFEEIYLKYLDEKNKKEYTTPDFISDLMIQLVEEKENKKIIDCFCGTGSILYKLLLDNNNNFLEGIEINEGVLKILFFRILFKKYKNISLIKGDYFENETRISIDEFEKKQSIKNPDIIFAHPPFGIKVLYNQVLMRVETALFYKTIHTLSQNGKAVLIIPLSYLKIKSNEVKKLHEILKEENLLEELIFLPSRSFEETTIETAIVVLNKNNKNNNIIKFWSLEKEMLPKIKNKKLEMSKSLLKFLGEGDFNDFLDGKFQIQKKIEKNLILKEINKLKKLEEEILMINNNLDKEMKKRIILVEGNKEMTIINSLFKEKISNLEKLKKEMKKFQIQLKDEIKG